MIKLLPDIGSSGVWTLQDPFQNDLTPKVAYKCVSIRRMEAIVADGGDPLSEYYETKHNIPISRYQEDIQNGVCIITLQATSGSVIHVPSSYVVSFPSTGGVPYRATMIAVDLSAIPKTLDLSFLRQKLIDATMETLGISADVSIVVTSDETLLDQTTNQSLESARQAKISERTTDRAKLLLANTKMAAMQQRVNELEAYIKAHP